MKTKKKEWIREIDMKYNVKVLWSFIKKYKLWAYSIVFVTFCIELVVFLDNFIFKYLIDKGTAFNAGDLSAELFGKIILFTVLIYFGAHFLESVFWFMRIRFLNVLDAKVMSDLEKKSFWHIMNLSYKYHSDKKTGSIISQFTRGVNKVESFIDAFMFHFFPIVFRLLLSIGIILYFDVKTAIVLTIMATVYLIVGITITNIQKVPQAVANYREDILKQNLSDVFLNVETVKYFAKEKRTFRYFSNLSNILRDARKNFWDYFSWHAGIQTTVIGLGIGGILYFSFNGFLRGELTLGTITLIYAAVWKLIPVLFGFIHGYRQFIRSTVDVDALFAMFKEENEVKDKENAKKLQVKDAVIKFENVSFAYPKGKQKISSMAVLKDFNLTIKKNTKVALVGPSGSGKTTVVRLLYRLFDIDEGKIIIDDQDISLVTQKSLRQSLSVVTQEPLLFDNTLYFNIAYANPTATKKQVWKAIRFAQLDKFIARLPYKENTVVGERGVKLSGGEKQRVSIARALLANKKILVLDEATSALDSETEKDIQKALVKLMNNRTSIIIAHRLSTIMKADIIVVMDKGKIVEVGSHKELANKRGGLYKRLWDLQQGGGLG
ncbi:ABC transporter ATP-binding protein [Candidatus Woesearchaeota archaeon]|nr:ABC transporter ATP-binding protein [Candidatus Woesearchaeota archaeon]MBT5396651.1 ABC transporter ATP-binding protein [Candidatus Woesearchaeota archaeon]MBT5924219.1 ABC transporter ATP-binding protein [Candidatus Woesearchaeota archaeon]MBT6367562.1 ABC transporter ATP-binding protein [Candidatus Woesearchaeota archaeon]MBT7763061.1 ABC transporter ATP-binding protein [Candidatus Woesearchaeota archaeon]